MKLKSGEKYRIGKWVFMISQNVIGIDEWYLEHSSECELTITEEGLRCFLKLTGAKRVKQ